MKILITAGPTYEALDPVRFLGNRSSGKMGFAIAERARQSGHVVTLISGPVALENPKGVKCLRVESAREMLEQVLKHYKNADALIFSAAVADFRPATVAKSKIKSGKKPLAIKLVPNPDIAATLGQKKGRKISIGFALETDDLLPNAIKKMRKKNFDFIILNSIDNLGGDSARITLIDKEEAIRYLRGTKTEVAASIIKELEKLYAAQTGFILNSKTILSKKCACRKGATCKK